MYIQHKFNEPDLAVLQASMRAHPLGAFVVVGPAGLEVNHLPFYLDTSAGPFGVLRGHFPKANPIWQHVDTAAPEAVVIFQGPQHYITPSWYPSKHAHGKAVPTWNYVVVHAYGRPVFHSERDWLLAHVTELTNAHEAQQALPWQVADAPADYIDSLLSTLVGVEIPITRLLGKSKLSQNRPPADRMGVAAGLLGVDSAAAKTMQQLVQERLDRDQRTAD